MFQFFVSIPIFVCVVWLGGVELTLINTLLSLRSTSVIDSFFERDMAGTLKVFREGFKIVVRELVSIARGI
jgi:hypothetical protein